MPELFIEPLTDRQTCFKCQQTVTGKKKLSKCSRCHAITYCGVACQKADWPRHAWNCVPVMVTEFEGKGRGVVAARDIKMGEFIFLDKPDVSLSFNSPLSTNRPIIEQLCDEDAKSVMRQVDNLPSEAKLVFYKLEDSQGEWAKELRIFSRNARGSVKMKEIRLYLNAILINHSCAPNAYQEYTEGGSKEVRAIKDISKGEEITIFYHSSDYFSYMEFGCNVNEWKQVIKDQFGFDCKCCVCVGDVPDQEDIIKELLELHDNLNPSTVTQSEEKRSIFLQAIDKILDLNLRLYIGTLEDKIWALLFVSHQVVQHHFYFTSLITKLASVFDLFNEGSNYAVGRVGWHGLAAGGAVSDSLLARSAHDMTGGAAGNR